MTSSKWNYSLIQSSFEDSEENSLEKPRVPLGLGGRWQSRKTVALYCFIALSLTAHIYMWVHPWKAADSGQTPFEQVPSRFAGLKYSAEDYFYHRTDRLEETTPADRDQTWDAMDLSGGVIALEEAHARELGLPRSQPFPWDDNKGVYVVAAFHGIHCLKSIQRYVTQERRGMGAAYSLRHIEECLDTLLQDLMCNADDTPWFQSPPSWSSESERSQYEPYQRRMCRNWDQLLQWTDSHSACFKYSNVSVPAGLSWEEEYLQHYRFCKEGSKDAEVMKAYFKEKGVYVPWDGTSDEGWGTSSLVRLNNIPDP